jgi:hypothetical protein
MKFIILILSFCLFSCKEKASKDKKPKQSFLTPKELRSDSIFLENILNVDTIEKKYPNPTAYHPGLPGIFSSIYRTCPGFLLVCLKSLVSKSTSESPDPLFSSCSSLNGILFYKNHNRFWQYECLLIKRFQHHR